MTQRLNPQELTAIRTTFLHAWQQLGAHDAPEFNEIVQHYDEAHRAYHTLEHVAACLRWLAESRDLAEHPHEVVLALIYHDVIYDPHRGDNEKRSAALFQGHAQASQLLAGSVERIAQLIEATATHRAHHGDAALVNDIDLAILGSPPKTFARYEREIRQEYQHVDESTFRAARRMVLESFLKATSIYSTPFFYRRLERQARNNLERSLSAQCTEGSSRKR